MHLGMPKLLVLLLGLVSTLLVVTTTVSAQPLSDLQQEALVAKDSDLRYINSFETLIAIDS